MTIVAVLLAAGAGSRLGEPEPKAFIPVAGRSMVDFSLDAIAASGLVDEIVLVVPSSHVERMRESTSAPGSLVPTVVAGGATRQESVCLGADAAGASAAVVVCHDAARPFASAALFRRVVQALADGVDGVIPVVASPDTVKRLRGGAVVETIPRAEVALAQTPQAFRSAPLSLAHEAARRRGLLGTDDASLLEAAGFHVVAVEGEAANFKVTTPEDLRRARWYAASLGRQT